MRLQIDWTTTSGAIVLVASLLLASPGVRVVHAEGGPQSRVSVQTHGPSCQAGPNAQEVAEFQAWMSEVRAGAAAEVAAPSSGDELIPLNIRG